MSFSIEFDDGLTRVVDSGKQIPERFYSATLIILQAQLRAESPVGEGTLRESWVIEGDQSALGASVVSTAEHARYLTEGTGIFGPKGTRIVAENGPFHFFIDGEEIFAWSIEGMPPNDFVSRALVQTNLALEDTMQNVVRSLAAAA